VRTRVWCGEPEGNRPLGISRIILKWTLNLLGIRGLDLSGSEYRQVPGKGGGGGGLSNVVMNVQAA